MSLDSDRKKLRRLILSSIDVDQALQWANYVLDQALWNESDDSARAVGRGLQTAMVIAYARPFSGNKNRKNTMGRLDLSLQTRFTPEEFKLHECIRQLRNTVFAHSDAEVRDLAVSVHNMGGTPTAVPISHNPYVVMGRHDVERFLNLATKLQSIVTHEIIDLQAKLNIGELF